MFINLTPHQIDEQKSGLSIPSTGIARIKVASKLVTIVDGVDIYYSDYIGQLEGLPEPVEGVIYIVSALALNAVPAERNDVVAPGDAVRDGSNRVIGCKGFRCRNEMFNVI